MSLTVKENEIKYYVNQKINLKWFLQELTSNLFELPVAYVTGRGHVCAQYVNDNFKFTT